MEIGHLPFLTQEDYSHFFNLFQDMDSNNNNNKRYGKNDNDDEGGGGGGGRKGKGNNDSNASNSNSSLKDILSCFILLDEEEKQEQQNNLVEAEQHKAIFNSSYDNQARAMNHYMAQFQAHHSQLDELQHTRAKRARCSALTQAVVAGPEDTGLINHGSVESSLIDSAEPDIPVQQQKSRRLWVKDRSKDWWEMCSHRDFPDEEFRGWFRMGKATFDMICDELEPVVMKKNTMLREAIPVRQRVAVCIWRLATGDPLRLVSKRFGLGISTCHKLVLEVCSAIRTVFMPKVLHWPDGVKMKMNKEEFEGISGIPNVGGAMYTTHIPIIAPKISVAAYYNKKHTERNQKTSYSVTVQGVVDPKGVFTDVCIGWPGSMPDDQVLEKSALYQRAQRGNLKDVWIVGNSGHPLMDWVLVPYTHQNLTWTQHGFNEKVGVIQKVAKEAFARLKGRWSCLQKRTEIKLQDLPVVLGACCVLHNICEMRIEEMRPEWKFELFDDEMVAENNIRSASSMQARDQIAHYLLHHGHAGTSFV